MAILSFFVDIQKNLLSIERLNNFLKITQLVSGVPGIPTLASGIANPPSSLSHGLHASAPRGQGKLLQFDELQLPPLQKQS